MYEGDGASCVCHVTTVNQPMGVQCLAPLSLVVFSHSVLCVSVLQRCQPSHLEPCGEQPDCEAAALLLYLTVSHLTLPLLPLAESIHNPSLFSSPLQDSRRVQKVLWRQLFVLDSMLSLLEGQGLESARQLVTKPCPPQPGVCVSVLSDPRARS